LLVFGNRKFVFTKKVLSWQRKLSPLESQPRLSRETLAVISEKTMKSIIYILLLSTIFSCTKKNTQSKINNQRTTFSIIDSKFPLYLDKVDLKSKENVIQVNDQIESTIHNAIKDFYKSECYGEKYSIENCYIKTLRLREKGYTIFVILLQSCPGSELRSKILFYNNDSKEFIGNELDFKIYALYNYKNDKLIPSNLKQLFKIENPEVELIDLDNDGLNEFKFTRLYHNGTFNAIETKILKVKNAKIITLENSQKTIGNYNE